MRGRHYGIVVSDVGMARHADRSPRNDPAPTLKRVLSAAETEEKKLGKWVGQQRDSQHRGKERLGVVHECVNGQRASKAALLEALPGWLWSAR